MAMIKLRGGAAWLLLKPGLSLTSPPGRFYSEVPMNIILASRSSRRKELLGRIVAEFRVVPSDVDESAIVEQDPLRFAVAAAEAKARDVGEKHAAALVIAADTVVSLGSEILGKPRDAGEARQMLEKLSGSRHRVITAVALFKKDEDKLATGYEITRVVFRTLTPAQIDDYLATGDFMDKAGSYAVQEVGDAFVEKLSGDYDNVVGFPLKCVRRMLERFLSPEHVVSITDVALPHDWGVGRIDNRVTFVPGVVLGDLVSVTIERVERRHQFARPIRVEQPSPYRAAPECPHFGVCGGCSFQDLSYSKQLELKENYLLRTLERIGRVSLEGVELDPIVPSPSPYAYRNKMEYAFTGPAGQVRLGLRQRASPLERYERRTASLTVCPIFSPVVSELFSIFTEFADHAGLPAYNPMKREGFFRNLVLREGKNTGETMALLVTRSGQRLDLDGLATAVAVRAPRVRSLWWVENDRVSDVVDYAGKRHVGGEQVIEERLGGLRLRITPESFFQPNPGAAEILYGRIVAQAQSIEARRALGLYCGSGSIELSLGRVVHEVVGVDSEQMNIRAAEDNGRLNDVRNCRFIEGRVETTLRRPDIGSFDLLVIDPPRAGISEKGMRQILGLGVPSLMYVSCNPAAFSRDVRLLVDHGYRLLKLGGFDFFPQTPHLEILGILARS
jgi:23S rRNA (uracil1939-C5)-methyltransferase